MSAGTAHALIHRMLKSPRMPRVPLLVPYRVEIVLDSLNTETNTRLTTFALTYPRFVHAELMTHRAFSRNSASSRAIPASKMRELIETTPALPIFWGQNQAGMQARSELPDTEELRRHVGFAPSGGQTMFFDETPMEYVKRRWLNARDAALGFSDELSDLGKVHPDWAGIGLHKQLCNRLTETWMPITVLVTSCTYANWFHLRDHKDAQPELQVIATEMHYQYLESKPTPLTGGWHMPYIRGEDQCEAESILFEKMGVHYEACTPTRVNELVRELLKKVSVGRCARVSYLTHEGKRDLEKDIELHDKLKSTTESSDPGHFSPFEHVAECMRRPFRSGNFVGWRQYRKMIPGEAGPAEGGAPTTTHV